MVHDERERERNAAGRPANGYLIHLAELVDAARQLRERMRGGDDWASAWMLVLVVEDWARTRRMMLAQHDPSVEAQVQALAAQFVAVLKAQGHAANETSMGGS